MQWRELLVLGMENIQRADRRRRTFAILGIAGIVLVGTVLVAQVEAWLANVRSLPVEAARESLMWGFSWCVGIGTVVLTAAGCSLWWWGKRVRCALRFPLPGTTVLRDTVVLEGEAAVSRGKLLQLFGITFMLCAAGIAAVSWCILRMFGTGHG